MEIKDLQKRFGQKYGDGSSPQCFFAPGRVNLIGEHTDYNGGYVLPCALSFGTYAAARACEDGILKCASANFPNQFEIPIEYIVYDPAHEWANYLKGVLLEFQNLKYAPSGLEIFIDGDIPYGAGLSSSASVELLMAITLDTLFHCGLDRIEMAKLCQRSENRFIGLNCGIMDQYAAGMGKAGHAVFLDCKEIKHEYVPLDLGAYRIIITNSNKSHKLSDSAYNDRRAECESALSDLRRVLPVTCLGEVSVQDFETNQKWIQDPTARKRARHVVYEDARVLKAVKLLQGGDLIGFGRLMNESHISMRDDFEITGLEMDTLAESAWDVPGVVGSRMTGGGFGGCTVSLVHEEQVREYKERVGDAYTKRTGLKADFYTADTGDGAKAICP